ncbi:hypothetical protein KIW84_074720 [Lathyrus oleraceus]|uniref:Uncharacterized protein n=1 Tax=Pisum sativum TaxID=3888 RepID=A0A9D4VT21_PEA|nr:hypothetical protein KIW84_074720 [Pisum sativum]
MDPIELEGIQEGHIIEGTSSNVDNLTRLSNEGAAKMTMKRNHIRDEIITRSITLHEEPVATKATRDSWRPPQSDVDEVVMNTSPHPDLVQSYPVVGYDIQFEQGKQSFMPLEPSMVSRP